MPRSVSSMTTTLIFCGTASSANACAFMPSSAAMSSQFLWSMTSSLFGQEPFDFLAELLGVRVMMPPRRRPGKSRVNVAHHPVAVDQDRSRIAVNAAEHRQRLAGLVGLGEPGDQRRKLDAEIRAVAPHGARSFCEVAVALEHQRNDLEPLLAVFAVEGHQKSRFVVAVRTPGAAERDQHHFAAEAFVAQRHRIAVDVA